MKLVSPGLGDDADLRSAALAVFGGVCVAKDVEFSDGIDPQQAELLADIIDDIKKRKSEDDIAPKVLKLTDETLKLAIADNGMGFADGAGKSVGSRLIKTFGLQLGGVSSVHSQPGQGTVVDLIFPDPDLAPEGSSA